jgi:alpha-tubulin suppressor-like RCC1 family protein
VKATELGRILAGVLALGLIGPACNIQKAGEPPVESKRSSLTVARLGAATALTSGARHSCALLATGQVACWGANDFGQLGTGDETASPFPVLVSGVSQVTSIAAGNSHTCAARVTGEVVCWGRNDDGELGDGTRNGSLVPVTVTGVSDATMVVASFVSTCALRNSGGVVCWGGNEAGELGTGSSSPFNSPVPQAVTGLSDAISISGGGNAICAVRAGGGLVCWGGSPGGSGPNTYSPVAIGGISDAVSVALGGIHACALRANGAVACWGDDSSGQLGNGTTSTTPSATAIAVTGLSDAAGVAAGDSYSCAARSNGQVVCWGSGGNGQLGAGTFADSSVPVAVAGVSDAIAVVASFDTTCALRRHGEVVCWGEGQDGQLGDGLSTAFPAPQVFPVTDAVSIGAGRLRTCVARSTGEVVCSGDGRLGQLGNGGTVSSQVPVGVTGVSDAVDVASGEVTSCALRSNGHVVCWGNNDHGELGDGTTTPSPTPVAVSGLSDAVSIDAAYTCGCALRSTGGVVCWGFGRLLGYGNTTDSSVPVAVVGLSDAVSISVGDDHSCALRANGQVTCWGYPGLGGLGDGMSGPLDWLPVTVSGLSDAVAVAAGGLSSCALRATGAVVCWGQGQWGQLGNGIDGADAHVPIAVPSLSNVKSLELGFGHTCALLKDGTVVCMGANFSGQLGNGTTVDSGTPVAVRGLTNVVAISAGEQHTCALRATGEVVCWGDDQLGELGIGTPWTSNTPVAVLGLAPTPNGETCGGDAECTNGFCVDGVCCESACDRDDAHRCKTCSASGNGTCTSLATTHVCRASAGVCDVEETCDATGACPADGFAATGSSCGGTPAACEVAGTCPGDGVDCGLSSFAPITTKCASSSAPCILDTYCPGDDFACPTPPQAVPPLNCGSAAVSGKTILLGKTDVTQPGAIQVTFMNVLSAGDIGLVQVDSGDFEPYPGYQLFHSDFLPIWHLKTNATYGPPLADAGPNLGNIKVCVTYSLGWLMNPGDESMLRLQHLNDAGVPKMGDPPNTSTKQACIWVDSLSPFALVMPSAPQITVPANIVAEATSAAGALVTYAATASDAQDGPLAPACAPKSGAKFPLGTTTVKCTATDSNGHAPSGSFTVTVRDTSGPVFSNVPTSIVAFATSTAGAKVSYTKPTATDAVDGARSVTCTPASGAQFRLGKSTVNCTATDKAGHPGAASFGVWVQYQAPSDGTFFLVPIRANGSSIFRVGRPVPVRFKLTGASAGITNLVAKLVVAKLSNTIQGTAQDTSDEDVDDTNLTFVYRPLLRSYAYRWRTRDQSQGTYQLRAELGDGVVHQVNVSLIKPK